MDRKKVTGRTDQGTKEFPGDEAYKKLFAKMLEEDKEKEKKKLEQSNKKKEKEEDKEKKSIQQAIKKNYQSIKRLDGSFKKAIARIGKIEKTVGRQQKKTTKIISILKTQQSNIGEKLPGSTGNELQKSLVETNKVLVDILKQMQLQSALEDKERRKLKQKEQIEKSKKRLSAKESELEKASKKITKETKEKTETPIKGIFSSIFDGILDFITLLGAGIATNAAFEWLKDEENQKKLTKFFNILKENWKLLANIFGTIIAVGAILKVAAAITTIGSVLAMLANPIVLGVLAGALAGYGLYKAGREGYVGGPGFVEAHDMLDATLKGAGITNDGKNAENKNTPLTQDQQQTYNLVVEKRERLYELKKKQDKEADEAGNKVGRGTPLGQGVYSNEFAYEQARGVVLKKYSNLARELVGLPTRATGGPVAAGQPYLVGERGPEIFAPNINGSIVNNMRTEKIVQTLSSDTGEGSINMINLPPITNQMPMPEVQVPSGQATDVPEISSINMADPYRQLSPMLYGITV
jgi:hypothetical protein